MRTPILLSLLLVALLPLSHAEAQARMDGCVFQVTIHTALTGPGASEAFAARVRDAVSNQWSGKFNVGECGCGMKVTVLTKIVSNCSEAKSSDPQYHCITVHNTTGVHRSQVLRSDFTKSLSSSVASTMSGDGQLEAHDSDNVIAHEFGHLMGLHDEYEDQYLYRVYDNKTKGYVGGGRYVKPSEYTEEKAREIQSGLESGQVVVWEKNNYGTFMHPVRKSGIENDSLMAGVGGNVSAKQRHADEIFAQCGLKCPDICCCGNARIDASKGEECDYKASPDGCRADYCCGGDCRCAEVPRCGDGKINGNESCDPLASPAGCVSGHECDSSCECRARPKETGPPDEPAQPPTPQSPVLTVDITNPADGSTIGANEPVIAEYSDAGQVLLIEYFIDGNLVYQSQDRNLVWVIESEMYPPGEHILLVRFFDFGMVEHRDEIRFWTE